jgi:hypothetical protein
MPRARAPAPAVALVALVALALGCASPQYTSGNLRCAVDRQCPEKFYCAADAHCWAAGTAPDLLGNPPSQCATSTALLCDGFEGGAIDPQWRVSGGGATVGLDTTRAYRGSRAIHVHTDSATAKASPNAGIAESRTFPISGTAWVRAWFYFQSPYSPNFNQLLNFLDGGTGGASFAMLNFTPANNDYGGGGFRQSTLPIPRDRWTCLRMSIGQGSATGDIHLFVDGNEASDAQLIGATVPQMVNIAIGADFYDNPAMDATDLWIDEVVIDNKPIACSD